MLVRVPGTEAVGVGVAYVTNVVGGSKGYSRKQDSSRLCLGGLSLAGDGNRQTVICVDVRAMMWEDRPWESRGSA